MTLKDIVEYIDHTLEGDTDTDDYSNGWKAALNYIRELVTGDFGNVN